MIKRVAYMLSSIVPCQQNDLWLTTIIALSLHIKVTWQVCWITAILAFINVFANFHLSFKSPLQPHPTRNRNGHNPFSVNHIMSADGEGTNEPNATSQQTPPQQQQQQQHQQQQQAQLVHQDLNFSINDILSNNRDVNDSSFQSIVQTLSNSNNEEHIAPSYAHLPAELQDLFNSNETDDLLSVQGTDSDASILQGNMSAIWDRPGASPSFLQSSPQQPMTPTLPAPMKRNSTDSPIMPTTTAAVSVSTPSSTSTTANHTPIIQPSPNTSSNTPTMSQPIQPQPVSRQSSQPASQQQQQRNYSPTWQLRHYVRLTVLL